METKTQKLYNWTKTMTNHQIITASWYELVLDVKPANPNWLNNLITVAKMIESLQPEPQYRGGWDYDVIRNTSIDWEAYFGATGETLDDISEFGFYLSDTLNEVKDQFTDLDIAQMQINLLKYIVLDQDLSLSNSDWFTSQQFEIVEPTLED